MFISPMLLQYAKDNKPFTSPDHVAELKLDGFRCVISNIESLHIYSRHNNDMTNKFPELLDCPVQQGTILDGELIVSDQDGKPDFEAMMTRFQSKRDKTPVTFCAFDIIRYRGIDVTSLPLLRRKELLDESFIENNFYKKVKVFEGNSIDYFNIVKQHGLEGIVQKKKDSKYEMGKRSWSWQKVINWTYAEVYITGYRKKDFGWLTSIDVVDGSKRPSGIIELGVAPEHKKALNSVRKRLAYKEDKNFVYIEPLIRAKVKTRNWTKNGMLRSPVFVEFVL
jgi:DNA ligase-1